MGRPESKSVESERRSYVRHLVCIPAYVRRAERNEHIALIRNISLSGALILTRQRLVDGEPVDLTLHLSVDPSQRVLPATAQVVRVQPLDEEHGGLWRISAGVRFAEPLATVEKQIEAMAARLRASLSDRLEQA